MFVEKLQSLFAKNRWKEEERVRMDGYKTSKDVRKLSKFLLKECEKAARSGRDKLRLDVLDLPFGSELFFTQSLKDILRSEGITLWHSRYVMDSSVVLSGWGYKQEGGE